MKTDSDAAKEKDIDTTVVFSFCLVFFTVVLLRNAWLCDDAFITFRTVDNFVNGYWLRWNVVERVQTYTNPLMMFTISLLYFFTNEIFYTSLSLVSVVSITAVWLVWKNSKDVMISVLGILVLTLSQSFIDYSTSGLENP